MKPASEVLNELGIKNESRVISAHRTPDRLREYVLDAEKNGVKVFIGGAGMAAALPGVIASHTHLPVLGVPIESKSLKGMDSLLSIAQMPPGIPVGTLAIGSAGSINAGLLAASILSVSDQEIESKLKNYRKKQSDKVRKDPL
jgi:5-(carboxyamino)imidazole ribonucleotide mutase